jgi:gliding motility-associated-like protein
VSYLNQNNCWQIDTINVVLQASPTANIISKIDFCSQKTSLILHNDSCTYIWNTGETTPVITSTITGLYWVQVTNQFGCINSDSVSVNNAVYNDLSAVLPNVITPNGDGINDKIDFGIYNSTISHLSIYNRWGEIIFDCSTLPCEWQPTQNDGTYFYTLQYNNGCETNASAKYLKGFFTIFR